MNNKLEELSQSELNKITGGYSLIDLLDYIARSLVKPTL